MPAPPLRPQSLTRWLVCVNLLCMRVMKVIVELLRCVSSVFLGLFKVLLSIAIFDNGPVQQCASHSPGRVPAHGQSLVVPADGMILSVCDSLSLMIGILLRARPSRLQLAHFLTVPLLVALLRARIATTFVRPLVPMLMLTDVVTELLVHAKLVGLGGIVMEVVVEDLSNFPTFAFCLLEELLRFFVVLGSAQKIVL